MFRMSNSAIIWTVAGILAVRIFALGVKLSDSQWLLGLTCCAVSSFIVFGAGLLWISLKEDATPSSPQEHMSQQQSGESPTVQSGAPSSGGLSRDEIAARIDVWRSVDLQMNRFMFAINNGYAVYSDWAQHLKSNKQDIMSKLTQLKVNLQQPVADIN